MKRKQTGFISGFIVAVLLMSLVGTALAASSQRQATLNYSDIKITLDGKAVQPVDANGNVVEPFSIDGTTYLPVRGISTILGIGTTWNSKEHIVELTSNTNAKKDIAYKLINYHTISNLGEVFEDIADNLSTYVDLIDSGEDTANLSSVIQKLDYRFDETSKLLELAVDSSDTSDMDIFQKLVDAQGHIVEMKKAALNYQLYKDSNSFHKVFNEHLSAISDLSAGLDLIEDRIISTYDAFIKRPAQ